MVFQQTNSYDCGILAVLNGIGIMIESVPPDDVDTTLVRIILRHLLEAQPPDLSEHLATYRSRAERDGSSLEPDDAATPTSTRYHKYISGQFETRLQRERSTADTAKWLQDALHNLHQLRTEKTKLADMMQARATLINMFGPEDNVVQGLDNRIATSQTLLDSLDDGSVNFPYQTARIESCMRALGDIRLQATRNSKRQERMGIDAEREGRSLLESLEQEQAAATKAAQDREERIRQTKDRLGQKK
ncbi:hypothetical protein C1H76_1672 [Elsinoe australis]|uniref:Uncharacterized protein n=1 Tax=Elsinoe australis TaxID=40998 RepID=A0A4U7BAP2_9PEZI|nr:hypothetical protein C1H76_1672 [Elsinoe australis]